MVCDAKWVVCQSYRIYHQRCWLVVSSQKILGKIDNVYLRTTTMKKIFTFAFTCLVAISLTGTANADIFINEIHYDNVGADEGEFIEIVTTDEEDANQITFTTYNGSNSNTVAGANVGNDFEDHGILADGNHYYSLLFVGLQNGSPDGIALANGGNLVEFLSYEGSFTGITGDAHGVTSTDIGVEQTGDTLVGSSLQRVDFGSTWVVTDGTNTRGGINLAAVPEPGSLIVLGLFGLAGLGRRRRM